MRKSEAPGDAEVKIILPEENAHGVPQAMVEDERTDLESWARDTDDAIEAPDETQISIPEELRNKDFEIQDNGGRIIRRTPRIEN